MRETSLPLLLLTRATGTDALVRELEAQMWTVLRASTEKSAERHLSSHDVWCAIIDDDFDVYGMHERGIAVIALVPPGDVHRAVEAMRRGARTVVEHDETHPLQPEEVIDAIDGYVLSTPEHSALAALNIFVRAPDSPLNRILDVVPQIARSDAPVLITGESGTGKDLLAKSIHATGPRRGKAFVAVNCAAIPQELLESELFGHVKGAFTGATRDKAGQFEAAHHGSIFLDEIGDMPAHVQVKLLRVLQEKSVTRVGSTKPIALDFRVIAATNQDLQQRITDGLFREDLYYRLSVLPIHMPPLRERVMDIPLLADHFIQRANASQDAAIAGLTSEVRTALKRYQWPGNVRELQNVMQRIAILKHSGFIEREDLDQQILSAPKPTLLGLDVPSEGIDMAETLERLEERLLARALTKAAGNKARAARLLGLNRTTFVEKIKRRQIEIKTDD